MTIEQFNQKLADIPNEELIKMCRQEISNLARTGGKSHKMCVPPQITDTDMILSEIIDRFENSL